MDQNTESKGRKPGEGRLNPPQNKNASKALPQNLSKAERTALTKSLIRILKEQPQPSSRQPSSAQPTTNINLNNQNPNTTRRLDRAQAQTTVTHLPALDLSTLSLNPTPGASAPELQIIQPLLQPARIDLNIRNSSDTPTRSAFAEARRQQSTYLPASGNALPLPATRAASASVAVSQATAPAAQQSQQQPPQRRNSF